MSCGIACIKYLLFVFNFIFALIGLALLAVGIVIHLHVAVISDDLSEQITGAPAIALIVIGAVIFVIAFFGCCGAIRESHCMVITFAVLLLTILIVQVAIGVWAFLITKEVQSETGTSALDETYRKIFAKYWTAEPDRVTIDSIQSAVSCCGVDSPRDFEGLGNSTIPWSCCGNAEGVACTNAVSIYQNGCLKVIRETLNKLYVIIGGVAIGVAGAELVGIIFAICLANSIRNDDRRGYRV